MKPNKQKTDWVEEFEIKYGRNSGRLTFYNEQRYYWNNNFYDEVKDFISKLLKTKREEIVSEIEVIVGEYRLYLLKLKENTTPNSSAGRILKDIIKNYNEQFKL